MTIYDESHRVPPEAENFTAAPEGRQADRVPSNGGDDSTQPEWLASSKATFEQEREQWKAGEDAREERYSAKWKQRAEALETLQPTGDIVADAAAFFHADEINPSRIDSKYDLEDESSLALYFGDLERTVVAQPGPERNEGMRAYNEAVSRAIRAIRAAHDRAKADNGAK